MVKTRGLLVWEVGSTDWVSGVWGPWAVGSPHAGDYLGACYVQEPLATCGPVLGRARLTVPPLGVCLYSAYLDLMDPCLLMCLILKCNYL